MNLHCISDFKNWNPMAEDFLSVRNSYKIDPDDPGVATTGISRFIILFLSSRMQFLDMQPKFCKFLKNLFKHRNFHL